MGTRVALRTQAPSRPRCRSLHVSHWPPHCPHSTAQPLPSPLPRARQVSGKGWVLGSRMGGSLCPSPSAPECKAPTPHSPHVTGQPPVPTPRPTPPLVLSLPGHEPHARGTGREGSPPTPSALPAPRLALPSQPCCSALWTRDLLSRRKWKGIRAQLCSDPSSGAQHLLRYHPGAAPRGQTLVRGYGVTTDGVPGREVAGTGTQVGHISSSIMVTCDCCGPGSAQTQLSPSRSRVHPWVPALCFAAGTSQVFMALSSAGYRLCPAHPAALARGFTIISPVPVSVTSASPLLLYPHSFPSTFHPSAA